MGLKVRFGQGPQAPPEISEAARRERAAARARGRQARGQRRPGPQPTGSVAPPLTRTGSVRGSRRRGARGAGMGVLTEAGKVVLEVFALLCGAWMAAAEVAGRFVLAIWLRALPPVLFAGRGAVAGVRLAQRRVEPAHGTLAVAAAALAVLAVSQFFDYRGISVAMNDYGGGVERVAPAPMVGREQTGDAHGWLVLAIAAAGLVAVVLAVLGRRGAARLLIPAGAAVLAIAFLVDMPKGLDEGSAAVAYEGVRAALLEGFWAQVFAAGTLIACGILLPIHLAALREGSGARGDSSAGRRRLSRTRPRRPKAARA